MKEVKLDTELEKYGFESRCKNTPAYLNGYADGCHAQFQCLIDKGYRLMDEIFEEIRGIVVGAYQSNTRADATKVESQILSGLDSLIKGG